MQCALGISITKAQIYITEVYNLESETRNASCHFGELAALLKGGNDRK